MTTILGLIAAIGFIISGVPLAWTVFQAPRLQGFSRVAYTALFVALAALTTQLVLLEASALFIGANAMNTGVVGFVTLQVFRKG